MRIRILLLISVIGILLCAPAMYACEDCLTKGSTDPVGNPVDKARCWASREGLYEGCFVNADYADCTTWDTNPEACPESAGGGGAGGGAGAGGSSTNCTRDASGACPSACFSCSGGGAGGGIRMI